ncbi:MAG TPA: MAPEG family protein [Rudaea sp.]|nr:MAPEG family protein [Rudaea sp.]
MRITGLYAAIAALFVLFLAARVIAYRRSHRIGLGDGGDEELRRRIRAHGNAIEYLPFGLLLLLVLELNQTAPALLHVFGIALLVARFAHAWGVSHVSGISPGRMLGVVLTFAVLIAMAVSLLWQWLVLATFVAH